MFHFRNFQFTKYNSSWFLSFIFTSWLDDSDCFPYPHHTWHHPCGPSFPSASHLWCTKSLPLQSFPSLLASSSLISLSHSPLSSLSNTLTPSVFLSFILPHCMLHKNHIPSFLFWLPAWGQSSGCQGVWNRCSPLHESPRQWKQWLIFWNAVFTHHHCSHTSHTILTVFLPTELLLCCH